ncbi:putative endonuclease-reverse transcriptase [Trichonephila clavipes]|nr:putative endonuclease-reverse transcriptase [Trichonephila clavipes]
MAINLYQEGLPKSTYSCHGHDIMASENSIACNTSTYASEAWPLTLRDDEALGIFERNILRCILGGIQVNGSWRRRSNLELNKIYKQPDTVKSAKLQRLKWASHLARMNEDRCCKKIFLAKPMENRPRGKPLL